MCNPPFLLGSQTTAAVHQLWCWRRRRRRRQWSRYARVRWAVDEGGKELQLALDDQQRVAALPVRRSHGLEIVGDRVEVGSYRGKLLHGGVEDGRRKLAECKPLARRTIDVPVMPLRWR